MKKIVCALLAVSMLMCFTSCGGGSAGYLSEPPPYSSSTVEATASAGESLSEEADISVEINSGSYAVPTENSLYETTHDAAQRNGGFYISQGEQLLDVGKQRREHLLIHCPTWMSGSSHYAYESVIELSPLSYPSAGAGGTLIAYSQTNIPVLSLYRIQESFYTAAICFFTNYEDPLDMDEFPEKMWKEIGGGAYITPFLLQEFPDVNSYPQDLQLNGVAYEKQIYEGFVPLAEGESVILSWYEGTQYYETSKSATHRYHVYDGENVIEIEGALTQNGYAEYDLSSVPDGMYWVVPDGMHWMQNAGIIEILN